MDRPDNLRQPEVSRAELDRWKGMYRSRTAEIQSYKAKHKKLRQESERLAKLKRIAIGERDRAREEAGRAKLEADAALAAQRLCEERLGRVGALLKARGDELPEDLMRQLRAAWK